MYNTISSNHESGTTETIIDSSWIPEKSLFVTRLKGCINLQQAADWRENFELESNKIDGPFKFIFDNHGYEPESMDVHKLWRDAAPLVLAKHGLVLSLLSEEEKAMLKKERD